MRPYPPLPPQKNSKLAGLFHKVTQEPSILLFYFSAFLRVLFLSAQNTQTLAVGKMGRRQALDKQVPCKQRDKVASISSAYQREPLTCLHLLQREFRIMVSICRGKEKTYVGDTTSSLPHSARGRCLRSARSRIRIRIYTFTVATKSETPGLLLPALRFELATCPQAVGGSTCSI